MTTYIIRRILGFIPVLLGVILLTFVLIRSIPGGPFDTEKGLPPQVKANRDYTLLLGITLLSSTFLLVANLMVDISYAWLDPRIRYD